MLNNIKEKIFEKHFVNCESADLICNELNIKKRSEFSELTKQIDQEKKNELKEMRRIRQLYHNKKGVDFEFKDFNEFYYWYISQYKKQNRCCYYCKTEESIITNLFEKKFTKIKRPNRGKHLEVERRDSKSNKYNKENCVLACYFCNNDKSDIFSEDEYFEYLKDRKQFFFKQFELLK